MRAQRRLAAAVLLGSVLGLGAPVFAGPRSERRTATVEVCERARAAIVNIHSERSTQPNTEEAFGATPQSRVNGMGTGIIIDPRGYVVTNRHVIDNVDVIRVRLSDGSTYNGKVLARDAETDLALLKIDAPQPLSTITIGTSSDLMVGETVIAIGNAYGYEHTATTGIISFNGRDVSLNKEVSYKALIQTNAAINPGNSGGPLLNIHGELVGVNVAIRAGAQGIGFAIPVDTMLRVTAEMLHKRTGLELGLSCRDQVGDSSSQVVALHEVPRANGAPNLLPIANDDTPSRALLVERIEPGSAAHKAGLEAGDVLVKVNDQPIRCNLELERALLDKHSGETVGCTVRRKGSEKRLELVMRTLEHPAAPTTEVVWKKMGLRLTPVNADSVGRVDPTRTLRGGMMVTDVLKTGAAGKVGVHKGDILVGLSDWETISLDNVVYVLTFADQEKLHPLLFYIIRSGELLKGSMEVEAGEK